MTLISVIYGNQYPVIVSDRAISDYNVFQKVVIPTTGRQTDEPTNVVDFRVKSVIIKDILCVAFAGMEYKIHEAYDEIVDYFRHKDVNEANLREFLNDVEFSNELSVLYALGGPEFQHNKIMVACTGVWFDDHSKEKLDVHAAGTGAHDWINHFKEYQEYLTPSGDKLTDCLHRALVAAVKYTSKEMHTVEHLLDGWGGGFDLIYYADGRFHRYDDVTYAFWYAKEATPDNVKFVAVNHNRYQEGNVIVFNIDGFQELAMEVSIIPQFRGAKPLNNNDVILACKSKDVITSIFIKRLNGTMDTCAVALKEWDDEASPMFLAIDDANGLRFAFKPEYRDTIQKALKMYLS